MFFHSDLDMESVVLDLTRACFLFLFLTREVDIARGDKSIRDIREAVYNIYYKGCNIYNSM